MRQRASGSWELRVSAGTGRRRYRTMTVRGTRAEAERELAALVCSVRAQGGGGPGSSVSVLLERWFTVASASWAPTTIRQTRSVLDRYLHPHIGSIPVGQLTAARIDELYAELQRSGGVKGQPLSAGTVARAQVVLRSALSQAVRWEWIWDNPAQRTHRITVPKRQLQPPTPTELETLLTHVAENDRQFYVFLVLAAYTGARRAQLLGLRWDNVSLSRRRLAFRAGWVEGPDGPVPAAVTAAADYQDQTIPCCRSRPRDLRDSRRLRRHRWGAGGGGVRVQRRRRCHGVEAQPGDQDVPAVPEGGRVAVVPAA